jgi:transcription elongation factor/antiterminator RfaH
MTDCDYGVSFDESVRMIEGQWGNRAQKLALNGSQRWYLVHTLPRKETVAQLHLRAQGFSNFLPRRSKTVRHARKLRMVDAPVFPRYLFVALDLERDRWRSVNGTSGVASLVMAHKRPVAVPRGVVETLIRSSGETGKIRFTHDFQSGQKVRLIAGPFAEALGVLDRLDDAGRIEVLLDIMGGGIRVKLARSWVEPAA